MGTYSFMTIVFQHLDKYYDGQPPSMRYLDMKCCCMNPFKNGPNSVDTIIL